MKNNPTAILCGDIHLREDVPICRTDNYWEAQWRKVRWLSALQEEMGCPILDSGDLYNKWKPSPYLLAQTIGCMPKRFYTVAGNHDLPQHNMELLDKSGINVLSAAKIIALHTERIFREKLKIDPAYYGSFPNEEKLNDVLIWHVMTFQGRRPPWPGCTDSNATKLLKKYPNYKLILTGHNHKPFVEEYKGRLLVNPGSMMRMSADQAEHKPRVYLWHAESNTVEPVYYPIEEDVVSREHLDLVEHREERMDSFISRLNLDTELGLSFQHNMEVFLHDNDIRSGVKDKIMGAIDG